MTLQRLIFASCRAIIDPLSDAAWMARGILRLLAGRAIDCRALTTGVLDSQREATLESILEASGAPFVSASADLSGPGSVDVLDLNLDGVRVTMLPTASSRGERAPDRAEALAFLDLAEQGIARFQPQALLVAGGHPADLELMARARRQGVPVVAMPPGFAPDRRTINDATAVRVPSEDSPSCYADRLRLTAVVIPRSGLPARVPTVIDNLRYVTFIDSCPANGVTVSAWIATEWGMRRPNMPILVVEGRAVAVRPAEARLDLSGLANLHSVAAPHDIREFPGVARPSLCRRLSANRLVERRPRHRRRITPCWRAIGDVGRTPRTESGLP